MIRENVPVPDPFDTAATDAWHLQVAAANATLNRDKALLGQAQGAWASPAAQSAARTFDTAQAAATTADADLDARLKEQQVAVAAVTAFKTGALATAQAKVAAATSAVSGELGRLMGASTTSATLTATIDGLALRERYRNATATQPPVWDLATIPFRAHAADHPLDSQVVLPVVGEADQLGLVGILDALDDSVDAIADLVAAEGVHQLVGGNLARSGAALEIAASGTVPDDLDVVRTPVRGYDVTHRVLLLGESAPKPAWRGANPSIIGSADPTYAAWLAGLLPDPAGVHLTAVALDEDTQAPLATVELTADVLGLDPVDWLRVGADRGELLARVAQVARPLLSTALGGDVTGLVHIGPPAATGGTTLDGLLTASSTARAVISTARALTGADLVGAGAEPAAATGDVESAAVTAVTGVQHALTALDADLAAVGTLTEPELLAALLRATALGLAEATPAIASGPVALDALVAQAASARARLAPRLTHPPFAASPAGPDATLTAARELLPALCGAPVPLLLPVPLPASAALAADLQEGSPVLPGADPTALRDWLLDHARVRPAVSALLDAFDAAETLGAAASLRPRATQLPRVAGAGWAGADAAPAPGLVDLVVLRTGGTTVPGTVVGLAVDAWVQTVPATSHDTGLAFHYDEPNADPPQAILVAVAPDLSPSHVPGTWDVASLVGVVTSTMALAADRAVPAELVTGASVQIVGGS